MKSSFLYGLQDGHLPLTKHIKLVLGCTCPRAISSWLHISEQFHESLTSVERSPNTHCSAVLVPAGFTVRLFKFETLHKSTGLEPDSLI